MNKSVKGIIAGVVAIAALGGAYFALKIWDEPSDVDEESIIETSAIDDEETTLNAVWAERFSPDSMYTQEDIKAVKVSNEKDNYEVLRAEEDAEHPYYISGIENHKLNYTLLDSMPGVALNLTISEVIEEDATDLSKYGLENPKAEVNIILDDLTEITILIGEITPDDSFTYMRFKDDNTVYTTSTESVNAFLDVKEYYVSRVLIDSIEDESKAMKNMHISRKDIDYDIAFEYYTLPEIEGEYRPDTSDYIMTEPVRAYLDIQKSGFYTDTLFGLTADSIVMLDPTEEDLELAGFNDPFCIITMETLDGLSYNLKISKRIESTDTQTAAYFAYLEGTDVIYAFNESSLQWLTLDPNEVMSQNVIREYVYSLSSVEVNVQGKETMLFEGTGTSKDDYEVTLNGEEVDTERFRTFYAFLINLSAEEIYMDEVTGEPAAEYIIKTQYDTVVNIKLYDIGSRKLAIAVNDKVSFICRSLYLDMLKDNIDRFDTDEDFVYNW